MSLLSYSNLKNYIFFASVAVSLLPLYGIISGSTACCVILLVNLWIVVRSLDESKFIRARNTALQAIQNEFPKNDLVKRVSELESANTEHQKLLAATQKDRAAQKEIIEKKDALLREHDSKLESATSRLRNLEASVGYLQKEKGIIMDMLTKEIARLRLPQTEQAHSSSPSIMLKSIFDFCQERQRNSDKEKDNLKVKVQIQEKTFVAAAELLRARLPENYFTKCGLMISIKYLLSQYQALESKQALISAELEEAEDNLDEERRGFKECRDKLRKVERERNAILDAMASYYDKVKFSLGLINGEQMVPDPVTLSKSTDNLRAKYSNASEPNVFEIWKENDTDTKDRQTIKDDATSATSSSHSVDKSTIDTLCSEPAKEVNKSPLAQAANSENSEKLQ